MSSPNASGGQRERTRERLLWLLRRATNVARAGRRESVTLGELEDSRRPLLFSLLPRMVRPDGSTPGRVQRAFGYVDQGRERRPVDGISSQRWRGALATSRTLAARRAKDRKP